jgi:hypothetical protein
MEDSLLFSPSVLIWGAHIREIRSGLQLLCFHLNIHGDKSSLLTMAGDWTSGELDFYSCHYSLTVLTVRRPCTSHVCFLGFCFLIGKCEWAGKITLHGCFLTVTEHNYFGVLLMVQTEAQPLIQWLWRDIRKSTC